MVENLNFYNRKQIYNKKSTKYFLIFFYIKIIYKELDKLNLKASYC